MDKFSENRFGLVTGSRCSPLVPKRSAEVGLDSLAKDLAKEIVFKFYDEVSTWQTEHGNMAEHEAFEYYQSRFDKEIKKGEFIQDGEIGASPDALGKDYGVDFKCPTSLSNWLAYATDGVSIYEYNQAQHYMMVTGFNKWLVCGYLTETIFMSDNGILYPIDQDKRMIKVSIDVDLIWQDKFKSQLPRLIELRNKYVDIYKTIQK